MEFLLIIVLILYLLALYYKNRQYEKGTYYQITKNPYLSVKYDKGKYAEYLTYIYLQHFEKIGGKFLFNIFIPKENNKITEIDVLLICSKGLFVFECKNYGGWIFGDEAKKNWTQTLPQGRGRRHKEHFYNPIMQNVSHIKHLKNLIGKNVPIWSIIVFSNRCILKDIRVKSSDISVVNHNSIASVVAKVGGQVQGDIYTEMEINDIYMKLYPYTQFDCNVKEQYIESIINEKKLISEAK